MLVFFWEIFLKFEGCMLSDISMNFGDGFSDKIVKKIFVCFYNISVVFIIGLCDIFLLN